MRKRTIIHQKFDIEEHRTEEVALWHKFIQDDLPENCVLITSPTELTQLSGDDVLINIDAKQYRVNEIFKIIEKASKYDELNK